MMCNNQREFLHIASMKWIIIKNRPLGGTVEFNGESYRKSGPFLAQELSKARTLNSYGFPAPIVIEETADYFVEKSLKGVKLANLIETEPADLAIFSGVLTKLLNSQLSYIVDRNFDEVKKGIHLDNVLLENPELVQDTALNSCISKLERRLELVPWSLCHGDLSPTNLFSDGIIDWEFSFSGPVAYDVLALPFTQYLYNSNSIQPIRNTYLLELVKAVSNSFGCNNLVNFQTDFIFMKALFYLSHMKEAAQQKPEKQDLWKKRKKILKSIIEVYGSDQIINEKFLQSN